MRRIFAWTWKSSSYKTIRNRAEFLNYVASVAIKQRDLDTASFYVDAAEEVSWHIRHEQRQAEVRNTLRSMQLLWPDEPKVKQLQKKLYERQR